VGENAVAGQIVFVAFGLADQKTRELRAAEAEDFPNWATSRFALLM
jgi:hypothetical protein